VAKIDARIIGPDSFSPTQLPLRSLEKPRGSDVHLWHLDLKHLSNPLNPGALADSTELSVFQQRTTRRFYLRLLLGAYLGLPGKNVHITRRNKGRPELDTSQSNGELNFNVARSSGCYLIGVNSGAPIGVDMEMATRRPGKPMALARRYFSRQEIATLSGFEESELHRAFMHTWACKEAIVKALGTGFAHGIWIRDVGIAANAWGRPEVIWSARGQALRDRLGAGEGHVTLTDEAGLVVAVAVLMRKESG